MMTTLRDLRAIGALLVFGALVLVLPYGHPLLPRLARAAERLG